MSRDHRTWHFFCSFMLTAGGIHAFNKICDIHAARKHLLNRSDGQLFSWKGVQVYYEKHGTGDPVILLHALHPAASSAEWKDIVSRLAGNHTVYLIDLPGCGRSDKPHTLYTNFYFVQLVLDFIHAMSLSSVKLVASNLTCPVAVMAAACDREAIASLVLINPPSQKALEETPDFISKLKYRALGAPILGAFIYNMLTSRSQIDIYFAEKYFYNPFHDTDDLVDTYYESAHLGGGNAHHFAACQIGKYINADIRFALSHLKMPVRIIEGGSIRDAEPVIKEWRRALPEAQVTVIEHTKQLPMLEEPEETAKAILS